MFFVDDDQPQILERQEQSRTGPGNHPHLSRHDAAPDLFADTGGKIRMPFGRLCPEPLLEPIEKARRECDFRQQDQNLLVLSERLGNRLEIDFRLAGPGDAIDQRGGKPAGANRRDDLFGRSLLRSLDAGRSIIRVRPCHDRRRR